MKRKVLVIAVAFMAVAMLVTPLVGMVMANPAQGQKVPITLIWSSPSSTIIEREDTPSGVSHRHIHLKWNVQLVIDGTVTLSGTAFTERNATVMPPKEGFPYGDRVLRDYYVLSFPTEGGGFEGEALVLAIDWVSMTSYTLKAHGLFHGTGAFEGQTINAGRDWGPAGLEWEGFLLKP